MAKQNVEYALFVGQPDEDSPEQEGFVKTLPTPYKAAAEAVRYQKAIDGISSFQAKMLRDKYKKELELDGEVTFQLEDGQFVSIVKRDADFDYEDQEESVAAEQALIREKIREDITDRFMAEAESSFAVPEFELAEDSLNKYYDLLPDEDKEREVLLGTSVKLYTIFSEQYDTAMDILGGLLEDIISFGDLINEAIHEDRPSMEAYQWAYDIHAYGDSFERVIDSLIDVLEGLSVPVPLKPNEIGSGVLNDAIAEQAAKEIHKMPAKRAIRLGYRTQGGQIVKGAELEYWVALKKDAQRALADYVKPLIIKRQFQEDVMVDTEAAVAAANQALRFPTDLVNVFVEQGLIDDPLEEQPPTPFTLMTEADLFDLGYDPDEFESAMAALDEIAMVEAEEIETAGSDLSGAYKPFSNDELNSAWSPILSRAIQATQAVIGASITIRQIIGLSLNTQ